MEYETKTDLILPFNGELMVSNGGRTEETNSHQRPGGPKNQVYAYDFRTRTTGKETTLEEFPVFGAVVIAPGDGKVIQVINGAVDCNPGESDRSVGVGNTVIIDHENGEYSVLCHFKSGSIAVKVGNRVKKGRKLGLCGNSGNTSQPHIHYHLQDHPLMHRANGLPLQFRTLKVNGIPRSNYEPLRFEQVSNL